MGGWLSSLLKVLLGILVGLLLVPALLRRPLWGIKPLGAASVLHPSHQHSQLQKQLWQGGGINGQGQQEQQGEMAGVPVAGASATVVATSSVGSPGYGGKGKGKGGKGKGKTKRSLANTQAGAAGGGGGGGGEAEGLGPETGGAAEVLPDGQAAAAAAGEGQVSESIGAVNELSQPSSSSNHSHNSHHSSTHEAVPAAAVAAAAALHQQQYQLLQQQLLEKRPSVDSNGSLQSLGAISPTPVVVGSDQSPAGASDTGGGGLGALTLMARTYLDEDGAAVIGKLRVGPAILGYGSAGKI